MPTGGCLCGAVRFEIDGAIGPITCCHCSRCRRASGSAFAAAASVDADCFHVVAGTDLLCEYESSPQNHRVSCARCGSQLYSQDEHFPIVRVRVGALDDDPGSGVAAHFMMSSKAPWFDVADGVEQFAELAPISYFLPDATLTRRPSGPAPRPTVALVTHVYQAFRDRDLPTIFGLLAPDVEITQASEIPWGGTYRGHEQAAAFFGKLVQTITSAVTLERFVDAGEQVVAIGRTRGTVNATGKAFDVQIAHVWTVRDGLVRRVEYYIDDPTMLAAFT